mgnify:FL=1
MEKAVDADQAMSGIDSKKADVSRWFRTLRDDICTVFESIEDAGDLAAGEVGRFSRKHWQREGGGGGEISMMNEIGRAHV